MDQAQPRHSPGGASWGDSFRVLSVGHPGATVSGCCPWGVLGRRFQGVVRGASWGDRFRVLSLGRPGATVSGCCPWGVLGRQFQGVVHGASWGDGFRVLSVVLGGGHSSSLLGHKGRAICRKPSLPSLPSRWIIKLSR